MVDSSPKAEVRETWERAAPGWAKWERTFSAGLVDATETLLDMAGVRSGMRVLDLACGAGSQTLQAARRVGPEGRVVATDISAAMLDHVRQSAAKAGLRNIETFESAAEDLSSDMAPFDAAIIRLGLMLFPAPARALEAVRQVLRPGARLAALVFTTPENNAFMAQPMAILLRHARKPPPAPGKPGLFALGSEGVLESLMMESGFVDVRTRTVRAPLRVPSASDTLIMMQEAFGAYRAVVADLSDAERSSAWQDVYECLKQFETDDGFLAELEFVVGSATRA